jgi:hypothetical protein
MYSGFYSSPASTPRKSTPKAVSIAPTANVGTPLNETEAPMSKHMEALKATAESIGIRWGVEERHHVTLYFGEGVYRASKCTLAYWIAQWKARHDAGDRSWFEWNAKVFAPGYTVDPQPPPFMKWLNAFLKEHTVAEALTIFREAEMVAA